MGTVLGYLWVDAGRKGLDWGALGVSDWDTVPYEEVSGSGDLDLHKDCGVEVDIDNSVTSSDSEDSECEMDPYSNYVDW